MLNPSRLLICFIVACIPSILAQQVEEARLSINGVKLVAQTDENYVCATLDWWPHTKCNYNDCPWGYSSIMNLNLSHPLLSKTVQAFGHLRLRLGGSLEDRVVYNVPSLKQPCHPFWKQPGLLFGFSKGCLYISRWDSLNNFFQKTGAIVTFGINALYGRRKSNTNLWLGPWDPSNAKNIIDYTISKGYQIDSWEFGTPSFSDTSRNHPGINICLIKVTVQFFLNLSGNELCGSGAGARIDATQYAKDVIKLNHIIDELYRDSRSKPLVIAPGGFFDKDWFAKFLQVSGPGVVNYVTHHMYNLGPGNDPNLVNKIFDPDFLSRVTKTFSVVNETLDTAGPWARAWVGESGGAYNSGGKSVSNTFANTFWLVSAPISPKEPKERGHTVILPFYFFSVQLSYGSLMLCKYLDQLGLAATYNTKVYCRQTLIGGNYGLLDTTTFLPNPDYYGALLWNRLMGHKVLPVGIVASSYLRSYAHCTKGRAGITILLINLSNHTSFTIKVQNTMNKDKQIPNNIPSKESSFTRNLKKTVSWVGSKASDSNLKLEEYHLTSPDGFIRTQTVSLNGNPLKILENGDVPNLEPVLVSVNSPLCISPLSVVFIVFPNFDAPACN